MVSNLVKGAFYDRVLINLLEAFETEGVAAGERERLLFRVVVLLEADTAFKY